jgi:hypothetical protein
MEPRKGTEASAQAEDQGFKAPAPRRPAAPPPRFAAPDEGQQDAQPAATEAGDAPTDASGGQGTGFRPAAPPPKCAAPPLPPKFAAPPARSAGAAEAAKAAAVAAARAAQHATPAQRERLIMEAASNVSLCW